MKHRFALGAFLAWFLITAAWWALAFAPLPVADEWLARARAICFGTLPDGLPDDWGWILLVLGPLSMLTFLVAAWGRDLAAGLAALARRAAGWLLLGPLAATLVFGVAAIGGRVAAGARVRAAAVDPVAAAEALPEAYPRGSEPAPPLPLVDQHGRRFDLAALRGRPVFLTFAYGHCPIVCPMLVSTMKAASRAYPGPPPPIVVVTLDPWRDTPGALPGVVERSGLGDSPAAWWLSGSVPEVLAVLDRYGIDRARDERTGDITHGALIYVLDGDGRIAYRFLGPPARWLVEAAVGLETGRR